MADVAGDVTDVGARRVQRGDHGPATNVGAETSGVDPDFLGSTTQQFVDLLAGNEPAVFLCEDRIERLRLVGVSSPQ